MTAVVALADGHVRFAVTGARMDVVLARPQARNAISPAMLTALTQVVGQARQVGAAVLTLRGEGAAFCAGADIASYSDAAGDTDRLEPFTRAARALCRSFEALDAVVISQVHGACLGGGFELAMASDLIIAANDARLGLPELRLGLIPGWGGTQRLTRLVGPATARSMILSSRLLTGVRAQELGIVSEAVEPAVLDETVSALADDLAHGPSGALAAAKHAIAAASLLSPRGEDLETELLTQLFSSADGREGVAAFVSKRQPRFQGA